MRWLKLSGPREERSFERCQSACSLQLQKLIPSPAVIRIDFQPVIHVRDIIFTLDLGNHSPTSQCCQMAFNYAGRI